MAQTADRDWDVQTVVDPNKAISTCVQKIQILLHKELMFWKSHKCELANRIAAVCVALDLIDQFVNTDVCLDICIHAKSDYVTGTRIVLSRVLLH
jgi:hypothetical protein